MVLERAEITVRKGHEAAFAEAFGGRGCAILLGVPGVKSVRFGPGAENPDKFLILVEWDSLEAHAKFKDLPIYSEFGQLFAPHAIGGIMEHFHVN